MTPTDEDGELSHPQQRKTTMTVKLVRTSALQAAIVLVSLLLLLFLLTKSSFFQEYPTAFSKAITLDLVFSLPLIYFLIIRKSNIPKISIVPFFIVGIVIASIILPKDQHHVLELIKTWLLPLVELAVLIMILLKIRATIQSFKQAKRSTTDFYTTLKIATKEALPDKVSALFAMEISMIYYGLLSWKSRRVRSNEFTYHRNTGTLALLGVFIFLIFIETFALHLLLMQWSLVAAWILTGISSYTALQMLAILKSMSRRPILVEKNELHLKYGLLGNCQIHFNQIESVEVSTKQLSFDTDVRHLSPFKDSEGHKVILYLKDHVVLEGLYGIKKSASTIAFHVDEPEEFTSFLEKKMKETE